jgi:hypothetical protein
MARKELKNKNHRKFKYVFENLSRCIGIGGRCSVFLAGILEPIRCSNAGGNIEDGAMAHISLNIFNTPGL